MYIRKLYDMGTVIDVEHYYPGNYGAPGVKRQPKKKKTPEQIERQNMTNRVKRLKRIILANFKEGDWHLILNYRPKDRPDFKEGKKQVKKFIDKVRQAFKKAGYVFKWIRVTEKGKKGHALHHHLIIENIQTDKLNVMQLIKKLWIYGNTMWINLYDDGEYLKLAEYLAKKETKDEKEWESYSRSRNLMVPQPERRKMKRKCWPEEPEPKKGYYIIKDSIVNGTNPVTGYPYQHYSMRKIKKEGAG